MERLTELFSQLQGGSACTVDGAASGISNPLTEFVNHILQLKPGTKACSLEESKSRVNKAVNKMEAAFKKVEQGVASSPPPDYIAMYNELKKEQLKFENKVMEKAWSESQFSEEQLLELLDSLKTDKEIYNFLLKHKLPEEYLVEFVVDRYRWKNQEEKDEFGHNINVKFGDESYIIKILKLFSIEEQKYLAEELLFIFASSGKDKVVNFLLGIPGINVNDQIQGSGELFMHLITNKSMVSKNSFDKMVSKGLDIQSSDILGNASETMENMDRNSEMYKKYKTLFQMICKKHPNRFCVEFLSSSI